MLTPFMVAMAPETPAQQPAAPAAVYNWENQGAVEAIDTEGMKIGAMASGSYIPGVGQTIDDWNLC